MDNFETVRQRARVFREKVETSSTHYSDSFELVQAAVNSVDYELISRDQEDTLLNGAEAVLDRDMAAIYYKNSVTNETAATLIAHELGHLDMHDEVTVCSEKDIDVSSPNEASPVGIERVEGYGVRERKELQANIFGREFLLPREEARKYFLDDSLTAAEIARRCRLPLDVVRQQLCDSLLIPAYPVEAVVRSSNSGDLDDSQRVAANHAGTPFLLEAGPGTGKTRTLVARILSLIKQGVEPASILALTFSNKAANEITERVADVLPVEAPKIWTGTFHAFGLELLRKYHQFVGLDPDIRLMDRSDAIDLLEELLPTLDLEYHQNLYEPALELKELLSAISRAKDELVDADTYRSLAEADLLNAKGEDEEIAAKKALEVAKVYKIYEDMLLEKKAVDFGDLIMRPVLLLEAQSALREEVQIRHRHILVDEYQDVNRASARLLKMIAGNGTRLWVVGDSRQSIYRFRGASSINMARFPDDFTESERKALSVNYRSTEEIINVYSAFSQVMLSSKNALALQLQSQRGTGRVVPSVSILPDLHSEISAVAGRVQQLSEEGVPFREQAVLCRSNSRLNDFAKGLEDRGIPVLHLGSLFERQEVRDMLSLLWFIVDPRGGGLMRVAAFTDYQIPLQDVSNYLNAVKEGEISALELLDSLDSVNGLSEDGTKGLKRLACDLHGVDKTAIPWKMLSVYLFDKSHYLKPLLKNENISNQMRCVGLYQFLNFIRGQQITGVGFPINNILLKIRRLVLLGEERDLRQIPAAALHLDAVRLMTIHGSKGLEFEAAHIPGMMTNGIPARRQSIRCPPPKGMISQTSDTPCEDTARLFHDEEEECLFFVALSRAKARLFLYRSDTQGSQNRNPSKYLKHIESYITTDTSPVLIESSSSIDADAAVTVNVPRTLEVKAHDIVEFERCPRRYFYSHVFCIAGSKRDGAFVKTHRCIYGVLDWLKDIPAGSNIDTAEALKHLDKTWRRYGPVDHGFETKYRELAERVINNLMGLQSGLQVRGSDLLAIDLANGRLIIEPDQLASLPDGSVLLRLIKTGKKGSFKGDDTIHRIVHESARRHYGKGGFKFEVLHLTDGGVTEIVMSERKINTGIQRGERFLADLASGHFPPKIDAVICPRCTHFFICPTIPKGEFDPR